MRELVSQSLTGSRKGLRPDRGAVSIVDLFAGVQLDGQPGPKRGCGAGDVCHCLETTPAVARAGEAAGVAMQHCALGHQPRRPAAKPASPPTARKRWTPPTKPRRAIPARPRAHQSRGGGDSLAFARADSGGLPRAAGPVLPRATVRCGSGAAVGNERGSRAAAAFARTQTAHGRGDGFCRRNATTNQPRPGVYAGRAGLLAGDRDVRQGSGPRSRGQGRRHRQSRGHGRVVRRLLRPGHRHSDRPSGNEEGH